MKPRKVRIETRELDGDAVGCWAVLLDAHNGRKLAETDVFNAEGRARIAARDIATTYGYEVVR
jgi:hypothetical protein